MSSNLSNDDKADLLLACRYGDLEDVQAFVNQHGASSLSDIRDDNHNSILHMSSANGHLGE
jgi:ankyrin repeat protein